MTFRQLSLAAACLSISLYAGAESNEDLVTIIGSVEAAKVLPGSGAVVSAETFEQEAVTDINQILKTVPGMYIREEDGNGLRPNIGIRGATSERSEKITLLEDGVLIAPAPYSNPAAYYFPTAARMHSVEVLKGAPLLRYGPQTTGGVVNLISTPIPEQTGGEITAIAGKNGTTDLHVTYGGQINDQFSGVLETVQRNSEGFKTIDGSNRDTGYDIEDYMAKLKWQGARQSVLFKAQRSEEVSNETYLGLTDADFEANPNRRYGLSEIDQMTNDHTGLSLVHTFDWNDFIVSSATVYRNEFSRDWFKLSGGGSYIDEANKGDADAPAILDGAKDVAGLKYKHNNRAYVSEGVELNVEFGLDDHIVDAGVRVHHDEMDRFQPQEVYNQEDGSLVFDSIIDPSGSNNREEEADAVSLWLTDDWQVSDALNVNLALRYEDVESARVEYNDTQRTDVKSTRENATSEFLPGISATYDVTEQTQVLAGYHKGFSPLGGGAKANEAPEISHNFELGARYNTGALFVEGIAFYSDFSDKTENCSVGAECSNGAESGTFVTGEAEISGLELQASTAFTSGIYNIPVDLAYTYTKAEIVGNDNASGYVEGDRLKDVPENAASLRVGLENTRNAWDNYAIVKYIDDTCMAVGCQTADEKTQELTVVDVMSRYALSSETDVFLKIENVFNEQKIISRSPDGARPNKPVTFSVGLTHQF